MNNESTYKRKYSELKMKFMNSIDAAFRLGYEEGMKKAMVDQAQQAAQQAAEASANANPNQGVSAPQEEVDGSGSEIDQHIAELEAAIGKSENNELGLILEKLKKSVQAPSLKELSKPVTVAIEHTEKASSMQEKIVEDIIQKWEKEEANAKNDILDIIIKR